MRRRRDGGLDDDDAASSSSFIAGRNETNEKTRGRRAEGHVVLRYVQNKKRKQSLGKIFPRMHSPLFIQQTQRRSILRQKQMRGVDDDASSSSSSSSDEFEDDDANDENKNKTTTDVLVEEAMREETRKLKAKLRKEKRSKTTVLPASEGVDVGIVKKEEKETEGASDDDNDAIKSKRAIEDATRARKRARFVGENNAKQLEEHDFEDEEKEEKEYREGVSSMMETNGNEEVKMDRFDMTNEEREGYFDPETGNYVEYKKEKKLAEDSWIEEMTKEEYEKFKTVKPSSQRLMEAEKAAEEDEEMKYDQTEEGTAKLKRRLAELLEGPTETALRAIKRVGGGSGGAGSNNNKNNKYVSKQQKASTKNAKTKQQEKEKGNKLEGENKRIFDEITAIASRLVAAGEYGAYTIEKQMLEKSANLVLKLEAKTTYEDAEDDMFADSDDDNDDAVKKAETGAKVEPAKPATIEAAVDPKTFSIKELKLCLESHGKSIGSGGERIDIEKMCLEVLQSTTAPEGFAYDKATGLYYGEASKMHWHCKADVYKTEDGSWWKFNGKMFEAASEP